MAFYVQLEFQFGLAGMGSHTQQNVGSVGQKKLTGLRWTRLTFWKYYRFISWEFTSQNRYFQFLHMTSLGSLRQFLLFRDFNLLAKYQLFCLEQESILHISTQPSLRPYGKQLLTSSWQLHFFQHSKEEVKTTPSQETSPALGSEGSDSIGEAQASF